MLSDSCIYLYKKFIRSLKYFNLMNFNASSRDSNYYRSNSHMKPNCFGNGFIKETRFNNLSCLPLGQMFGRALPVGQYDPVGHTKAVGAPVVWPSGQ